MKQLAKLPHTMHIQIDTPTTSGLGTKGAELETVLFVSMFKSIQSCAAARLVSSGSGHSHSFVIGLYMFDTPGVAPL